MSEEIKKGGGGIMLWILVPVIAAGAGFASSRVLFPPQTVAQEEELPLSPPEAASSVYVPFEEITVNLNDQRLTRYLHIAISLQIREDEEEEFRELLQTHRPMLKTWMHSYLGDLSTDEVRGAAGQQRIRREIQAQFNSVLFGDGFEHIYDVVIEQFNVQ